MNSPAVEGLSAFRHRKTARSGRPGGIPSCPPIIPHVFGASALMKRKVWEDMLAVLEAAAPISERQTYFRNVDGDAISFNKCGG